MSSLTKLFMSLVFNALLLTGAEKNLQLPDFTKWADNDQWCANPAFYKGKKVIIVDRHYNSPVGMVGLYSRPIPFEQLSNEDGSRNENRVKEILSQVEKDPLFVSYLRNDQFVGIFERTKKWYEFWRAWQPKWRLMLSKKDEKIWSDEWSDEDSKLFWEKRYGIKVDVDEN